jgi:hypothetical protein
MWVPQSLMFNAFRKHDRYVYDVFISVMAILISFGYYYNELYYPTMLDQL